MKKVLITGGTGLIGKVLLKQLIAKNYQPVLLSRSSGKLKMNVKGKDYEIEKKRWNVEKNEIDKSCFDGVEAIIHLAGEGIADKRWTAKRKQEIIDSRVNSAKLLADNLPESHQIKKIVSASAIGFYGGKNRNEICDETAQPGTDFLAKSCVAWENSVENFFKKGITTAILRVGIVLAKEGGALPAMIYPVKWWVGAPIASGKQPIPWIHIEDIAAQFVFLLENENLQGIYNGVAPNVTNNLSITKLIGKYLHHPIWLPNVPAFVLNLMLGELSVLVTDGNNVSGEKIKQAGFQYKFENIETALSDLLEKS
jgi:uncharacterized protein (TIGR01777 family)